MNGELEVECQSAAYGARRLDKIDGPPVLAKDRNISLSQKVAYFDNYIHMTSQRLCAWNRLRGRKYRGMDRSAPQKH